MNLQDAKIGDKVRVFLDPACRLSSKVTAVILESTVIATLKKHPDRILLGWKSNEITPVGAYNRVGLSNYPYYSYIENDTFYTKAIEVYREFIIDTLISKVDSYNCKRCRNYVSFSAPNQKDGSFVCWSCRH